MDYRHELKFMVSKLELEKIKYRLYPLMQEDIHNKGGYYTISSLYFDDIYDSCLAEIEKGISRRRKFRIRMYNDNFNVIRLEKKSKRNNMTRKESARLTVEDCERYIAGEQYPGPGGVKEELYRDICRVGMRPKCIVAYERMAFVEEIGNVRVTFDEDIRGTMEPESFLKPEEAVWTPALPAGMHVLEVKYDEFLPNYILQAIDLNYLQKQSLSKYAWVRYAAEKERKGLVI